MHLWDSSLSAMSLFTNVRKEAGIEVVLNEHSVHSPDLASLQRSSGTSKKSKIAVVGMAGRFPSAADHEKLWKLLEAGLDVHRKVRRP